MDNSLDEFGVFFRESDLGRSSVIVDLTVGDSAPFAHLPNLLRVMVVSASKSPELPGESDSHIGIELDLIAALSREVGAVFAARELTHRQLKFYFYTPLGTTPTPVVDQVLRRYPDFRYRLSSIPDPEWTIYFDELYPSRVEFQLMASHERQVSAIELGDSLQDSRPICHWIYFATFLEREQFLERIRTLGFKYHLLESRAPDTLERPYCVELARNDRADHPYLDELVLWLCREADECGGEYDGFEAESVTHCSLDLSATVE